MTRPLLALVLLVLMSWLPPARGQPSGRLSIADIETLLGDALSDPAQRPLLNLLRATVCGSPDVRREIDVRLLARLDCAGRPAARGGPSFDCRRARTDVELLICRDAGLAALDVILADAYAGVMTRLSPGERAGLRRDEDRWIAGRDRCAGAGNTYACVTRAYTRRIQELNGY